MQLINLLKPASIGLLVLSLGFSACTNSAKQQQEDLQTAVIAIHDTVMMDMGTLTEKRMQIDDILKRLDSLKVKNPELDTAKTRNDLTQVKTDLAAADEEMMDWMHHFDPDYTGKSHEEVMTYLNQEKEKINKVEKSFKNVIIKSDSVIKKYN